MNDTGIRQASAILAASDFSAELQVNILASLIVGAATYVAVTALQLRLPTISSLFFWRAFTRDLVTLISEMIANYDPKLRRGDQPPLTPLGDALTLANFLLFFRTRFRRGNVPVLSSQDIATFDRVRHHNLLIIGGPKYNFGADAILSALDPILPYQFRRLRPRITQREAIDLEMKKFVGRGENVTSYELEPDHDRDFGCLVVAPNPFNAQRWVVVVSGLSSLSTLAAAECIKEVPAFAWLRLRFRHQGFQLIASCISADINRVTNIKVEFFNQLGKH